MSDRWGRPSVLDEIIWILSSPIDVLCQWVFPRGSYCKEDEYGRCRLLQVAMYMHCSVHLHSLNLMVGIFVG